MEKKTKILISLIILALLDMVVPIPFTAILMIYVLMERPGWFRDLFYEVYRS